MMLTCIYNLTNDETLTCGKAAAFIFATYTGQNSLGGYFEFVVLNRF